MDNEYFTQDQLLHSTSALSTVIDSFESSNVPEFCSLRDGLSALQDMLWASRGFSDPTLPVLYFLCSTLCDELSGKLSNCHSLVSNLENVLVLGHNLPQISRRLRNLFHALITFLNMRFRYVKTVICKIYIPNTTFSITAELSNTRTYQRCMYCVACSMHGLQDYLTHLQSLYETRLVLEQQFCICTCLEKYFAILKELRVSSLPQTFCECTSRESNRTCHKPDDISVTPAGSAALNHFSEFGRQLLKEVDQKQGSMKKGGLGFH